MTRVNSEIPTLYTIVTPIRSVAFANHCVWVEKMKKDLYTGSECAIYYEPYPNQVYPFTVDAIFVEIVVTRTSYTVAGFAVFPDKSRREMRIEERHSNYRDAKHSANQWVLSVREAFNIN
ncbi:hypothetical protein SATMO3_29980 [Sporomusa aerivorans]